MKKTILIVDDEQEAARVLQRFLVKKYNILTAYTGSEALEILDSESIDLMLLDLGLPDIDGMKVLEKVKELPNETATLVITGNRDVKMAVKAMQLGAYNYIVKPPDLEELKMVIDKIFEKHELINEVKYLRSEVKQRSLCFQEFVGESQSVNEVLDTVSKAAKTDTSVFITGDSGTGKELIARAIHAESERRNRPFIAVSCPNLPSELVESELFGHQKGAFTGAIQNKVGKFETANNGTIFLDEIAEMKTVIQAKLLRVIQEREYVPVGSTKTVKVNVRVIAATNRNVKEEIEKANFREDLYYRLSVIPISLPTLRERLEDIPLLVTHFIELLSKEIHCKTKKFSSEAIEVLQRYDWPGNVRELRNVIERAMSLYGTSETIGPDHLPDEITKNHAKEKPHFYDLSKIDSLDSFIADIEKDLIIQALQQSNSKVAKAARMLNIAPWILRYKVKKFKIDDIVDTTS